MTRYFIEDTDDGYRMGIEFPTSSREIRIEEVGGHGPIERVYAVVQSQYNLCRASGAGRIVPTLPAPSNVAEAEEA